MLPFGSHSEYATGEERILIRGWLHLAAGVGVFLLLFTNWDWILTLPVQLQLLLVMNSVKGTVSGTLHVLVPPHAPLLLLFAVHFVDIVVIVVSMCVSGLAFQDTSTWNPLLMIAAVGSVLVGLCEAPLWPLKLMRPPGKEHFSVKIRYAVMLSVAMYVQWLIFHEVHPTGGIGTTNYWIQFCLYVFGFHSTVSHFLFRFVCVCVSITLSSTVSKETQAKLTFTWCVFCAQATRPERAWHRKGFYEAHDDLHTVSVVGPLVRATLIFSHLLPPVCMNQPILESASVLSTDGSFSSCPPVLCCFWMNDPSCQIADIMIVCMAFQRWHVPLLD